RARELPLRRSAPSRAREQPGAILAELAPALPLYRRLDAERHREEPPILAMAADDRQPDGRLARRRDRNRDGATIEEIDRRRIAKNARVEAPKIRVLDEGSDGWRYQRQRRHDQRVDIGRLPIDARDEIRALIA